MTKQYVSKLTVTKQFIIESGISLVKRADYNTGKKANAFRTALADMAKGDSIALTNPKDLQNMRSMASRMKKEPYTRKSFAFRTLGKNSWRVWRT